MDYTIGTNRHGHISQNLNIKDIDKQIILDEFAFLYSDSLYIHNIENNIISSSVSNDFTKYLFNFQKTDLKYTFYQLAYINMLTADMKLEALLNDAVLKNISDLVFNFEYKDSNYNFSVNSDSSIEII